MRISGYLVPFPDSGAADLMSDHLEQQVQATGPGRLFIRVYLPKTRDEGREDPSESGGLYSRKKLELFRREGNDWMLLWTATSDSRRESEEVSWEVLSAGTLKCRLTNMGGGEGQFSLECAFMPSDQDQY